MRPALPIAATVLGLCFVVASEQVPSLVVRESWGFLFVAPFALGFLALRAQQSPTRLSATFVPWIAVLLLGALVYLTKRESTLAVAMALPVALLGATLGGLVARGRVGGPRALIESVAVVAMPLAVMALELRVSPVAQEVESIRSVNVAASVAKVWDEVAEIDSLPPDAEHRDVATVLGLPAVVAAALDLPQEAGARTLLLDQGAPIEEIVVQWEPERRLVLAVLPRPSADTAPKGRAARERDVTLLADTYDLERVDDAHTRVRMSNQTRVTSRLGLYATWWARVLLQSAQERVLASIQSRSEAADRVPKARIRAATAARALREVADERASSSMGMSWSVVGALNGRTDVYADSVVALVRDGDLLQQRSDAPQVLDSVTASMASESGKSWSPGAPSPALVLEWHAKVGEHRALGPMQRFTIPREPGASLDGRWVVFTYHLSVPKTADNPYGLAWTYTHATRPEQGAP